MSDQVLILATAILIALSAIGMGYSVRRLRRETRLSARTWLLGAGVPAVATLGYLLFGGPPFHFLVVLVMFTGGLAITSLIGAARSGSGGPSGLAHQTSVTLAIWAIVYVLAALTAFIPRADSQALMAVLLALCAGLAAGTQVGLALRMRQVATQTPAMAPAVAAWTTATGGRWQPTQAPAWPQPVAAAPAAPPPTPAPVAAAPAPPAPAPETIHFTHSGGRFLFGYTATYIGIWDLANRQGALAQFARTPEGRAMAWSQFSAWEPRNAAVVPYPGLVLEPIADVPVTFTHVGIRFALGRTADGHGIWDRWSPGLPVARFGLDVQGAAQAWQTFNSWEPRALRL